MKKGGEAKGYGFGTFQGVFTPSILTIIGVVMYLRFGWMLGHIGLAGSLLMVAAGSAITLLTGLSISALATNMRMKGGGAYFMLSRSLGLEAGAALGIPLALSQAIGVSFYVAGFAEALVQSSLPVVSGWDPRAVGLVTLAVLAAVSTISADIALKTQYFVMAAIAASLVSFFAGSAPPDLAAPAASAVPPRLGFWPVFAVFFPAVTGILSGLGMSGDLKNPERSIPVGTMAAVLTGFAVYTAVPLALDAMVSDAGILRTDTMILQKCTRWQPLVLAGVWAATLSSAVGSFLCAPRVMQALSRDGVLPQLFARGFGRSDEPRLGSLFCFAVAAAGICLGDINAIAPVLTLFNLSTYGLLNLSAALEETMSNPSWRPSFRVKAWLSFAGFAGCLAAMFMISSGWTFVAVAFEFAVYWTVKRRALAARWGDMRTGLMAAIVRMAFRSIERRSAGHAERNWRPNLLVMARLPIQNMRMLELARDISCGRSFVTVASVVPESMAEPERAADLRGAVKRTAERIGLDTEIKLLPAADDWAGLSELVRTYGFGPVTPNTVVLGLPEGGNALPFASLVMLAARSGRNIIAMGGGAELKGGRFIDVWLRGGSRNGALMLALACLMQRGELGRDVPLRVNTIVNGRTRQEAEEMMAGFLRSARIRADVRIVDPAGRPFEAVISENSGESFATFVGLREPAAGETAGAYCGYLSAFMQGLASVPLPVFALAAEDVDFRRIFS